MKSKIGGVSISKEDIEHLILATTTSLVAIGMAFCVMANEGSVVSNTVVAKSSEINGDNKKSRVDFLIESYNQPALKAYANQEISSELLELERRFGVPENSKLDASVMTKTAFYKQISEQYIPLTAFVKETTTNNEIEEQPVAYEEVAIVAEESVVTQLQLSSEPEANVVKTIEIEMSDTTESSSEESKDDVVIHESVSDNSLQDKVNVTEVPAQIASAYENNKPEEVEYPPLEELTPEIKVEPVEKIVLQSSLEEKEEVKPVEAVPGDKVTLEVDGVEKEVTTVVGTAPSIVVDTTGETVSDNSIPAETAIKEATPVDVTYQGCVIDVGEQREFLERLVMGEAGNQGFEGAALVAQSLRDNMIAKGTTDVKELKKKMAYSGSTSREPNEDVKAAVAFIFDQGGCAVQHRINYFYNPEIVSSSFHESQQFIIEYGNHRFFSTW